MHKCRRIHRHSAQGALSALQHASNACATTSIADCNLSGLPSSSTEPFLHQSELRGCREPTKTTGAYSGFVQPIQPQHAQSLRILALYLMHSLLRHSTRHCESHLSLPGHRLSLEKPTTGARCTPASTQNPSSSPATQILSSTTTP